MFRSLLNLLTDTPAPVDDNAAELALAALLVRLARADDSYDEVEKRRIDRILIRRHKQSGRDLTGWEATELRHRAEEAEAEAPDTVRFTRLLKSRIPYENRAGVIEALWDVALADDARSGEEEALIRLVASLLGINDRDSALARQRVIAARG